jgi:hypothetical protein
VRLDQVPVDGVLAEQGVDVAVAGLFVGTVEDQIVPVADPGQQVEPEESAESEDRQRLALRIRMDGIGLDVAAVLPKSSRFAAWAEVR